MMFTAKFAIDDNLGDDIATISDTVMSTGTNMGPYGNAVKTFREYADFAKGMVTITTNSDYTRKAQYLFDEALGVTRYNK